MSRLASQPPLFQGNSTPLGNSFSGNFPTGGFSMLAAQRYGQAHPNPLAKPSGKPVGATTQAVLEHQQKAGYDWLQSVLRSACKLAEDDDEVHGNTHMRGWQWKALQREEERGQRSWFPRVFKSKDTPLAELLASPGRQGLLRALGGGAVGALGGSALAGLLGSHYSPTSPMDFLKYPLIGGVAGAATQGLAGYAGRRKENDRIVDAMRKLPPGATSGDYDDLNDQALKGDIETQMGHKFADAFATADALADGVSMESQTPDEGEGSDTAWHHPARGAGTSYAGTDSAMSLRPSTNISKLAAMLTPGAAGMQPQPTLAASLPPGPLGLPAAPPPQGSPGAPGSSLPPPAPPGQAAPPGQPAQPGQPGQPGQPSPGPQPPSAAPPPPALPANTPPNPPGPQTEAQALQTAAWLGLSEQANQQDMSPNGGQAAQDIDGQLMGAGVKEAISKAFRLHPRHLFSGFEDEKADKAKTYGSNYDGQHAYRPALDGKPAASGQSLESHDKVAACLQTLPPFARGFFSQCLLRGCELSSAVKQASAWEPRAAPELADGLQKLAGVWDALGKVLGKAGPALEHAAPAVESSLSHAAPAVESAVPGFAHALGGAVPAAESSLSHAAPAVESAVPGFAHALGGAVPAAESAVPGFAHALGGAAPAVESAAPSLAQRIKGFAGGAKREILPTVGGAIAGGLSGDQAGLGASPGYDLGDTFDALKGKNIRFNYVGAGLGAAAFNPTLRNQASKHLGGIADVPLAGIRGMDAGGLAGQIGDEAAGDLGIPTNGALGRAGMYGGAGLGLASRGAQFAKERLPQGSRLSKSLQGVQNWTGAPQDALGEFGHAATTIAPNMGIGAAQKVWNALPGGTAARLGGGVGLGLGALGVASKADEAIRGYSTNVLNDTVDKGMQSHGLMPDPVTGRAPAMDYLAHQAGESVANEAAQRGLPLNKFVPDAQGNYPIVADLAKQIPGQVMSSFKGELSGLGGQMSGLGEHLTSWMDPVLQHMGVDPRQVPTGMRLMILLSMLGIGGGALGFMGGHPGMGAMSTLGGVGAAMPFAMNQWNQYQGRQQPQGG